MLRRKKNAKNEVERYKARLIILGNLQQKNNIRDIYSLVVKYAIIRVVLGIAAIRNLKI